jgi:hypothetical protein
VTLVNIFVYLVSPLALVLVCALAAPRCDLVSDSRTAGFPPFCPPLHGSVVRGAVCSRGVNGESLPQGSGPVRRP